MASKYYYLVASLPYLYFDEQGGMTKDLFLEECRRWLEEGDLNALLSADIAMPYLSGGERKVIREWKLFDMALREVVAAMRTKDTRLGAQEKTAALKEKLEGKDPLESEKIIEKIRWDFLEGEEYKYTFDINWLILYWLKVQILERLSRFDHEQGIDIFNKLCEVTDGKE